MEMQIITQQLESMADVIDILESTSLKPGEIYWIACHLELNLYRVAIIKLAGEGLNYINIVIELKKEGYQWVGE